jgi:23S rRNA pseudouridine1911/1915/1917 synthase
MRPSPRIVRIPPGREPARLDRALAKALTGEQSRTVVAGWIREGRVRVGGLLAKPAQLVGPGDEIAIDVPVPESIDLAAEPLGLPVVYEDESLLVVDKPAGMSTHPAGPIRTGTMVNALLHHVGQLSQLGGELRPGIVHRLDKGTSGLLVVAKTDEAHRRLSLMLRERRVSRIYEAIAWGSGLPLTFTIDAPIGRHPRDRKKMAVVERGKEARSHARVMDSWPIATRLEVTLETGRTHQIRVHLAHQGHPVVGDATYGGRRVPAQPTPHLRARAIALASSIGRPALHARSLRFDHPFTDAPLAFSSPLPADFTGALRVLADEGSADPGSFR